MTAVGVSEKVSQPGLGIFQMHGSLVLDRRPRVVAMLGGKLYFESEQ